MRLLQRKKEPPAEWQSALDRIFGTHEWIERFYITKAEPDFFDAERISSFRTADWNQVAEFMLERLALAFEAVSPKPGVLWNSQNSPLYLLCFAAANRAGAPTALKIAADLLKNLNS